MVSNLELQVMRKVTWWRLFGTHTLARARPEPRRSYHEEERGDDPRNKGDQHAQPGPPACPRNKSGDRGREAPHERAAPEQHRRRLAIRSFGSSTEDEARYGHQEYGQRGVEEHLQDQGYKQRMTSWSVATASSRTSLGPVGTSDTSWAAKAHPKAKREGSSGNVRS